MNDILFDKLEDMGAEVDDTLDRLMGDEELYVTYLRKLPEDGNAAALQKAVAAGDYAAAERAVHTLKGIALNLGLLPLADVCIDLLLDLRAGKTENAAQQAAAVEESFAQWCRAISE